MFCTFRMKQLSPPPCQAAHNFSRETTLTLFSPAKGHKTLTSDSYSSLFFLQRGSILVWFLPFALQRAHDFRRRLLPPPPPSAPPLMGRSVDRFNFRRRRPATEALDEFVSTRKLENNKN